MHHEERGPEAPLVSPPHPGGLRHVREFVPQPDARRLARNLSGGRAAARTRPALPRQRPSLPVRLGGLYLALLLVAGLLLALAGCEAGMHVRKLPGPTSGEFATAPTE